MHTAYSNSSEGRKNPFAHTLTSHKMTFIKNIAKEGKENRSPQKKEKKIIDVQHEISELPEMVL